MSKPSNISERDLQQAVRRLFHNHRYILVNSFVFNWESDLFSVTKTGTVYEVEMKISKADYRKDFEKEKHWLFQSNIAKKTHHIHRENGRYMWDKNRLIAKYIDPGFKWQHPEGYYRDRKTWDYVTGYGNGQFAPREKEIMAECTPIKIVPIEEAFCPNRFYYACTPGIIDVKDLPSYAGLIYVKDLHHCEIVKQAPMLHKRNLLTGRMLAILLDKFWYLSQNQRVHLVANNIHFKDCGTG